MKRILFPIATLSAVIACAVAIQAQTPAGTTASTPASTPGKEPSPTLTEAANPLLRQKPLLDIELDSRQSAAVQLLASALESAGVTTAGDQDKAGTPAADGIVVTLTVRSDEPFERVRKLIEGLQAIGVGRFTLQAASEGTPQSSAMVVTNEKVPDDARVRLSKFIADQKSEIKVVMSPPRAAENPRQVASDATSKSAPVTLLVTPEQRGMLLVLKSDWSQVPTAKEIEADLRQLLKGVAIPQEQLDRLPAFANQILFPPEGAAIYRPEHYAQLLFWLSKHGLVAQTFPSNNTNTSEPGVFRTHLRNRCEFLHLTPAPQSESEPFISRWMEFVWDVVAGSQVEVYQRLVNMELGRGQPTARERDTASESRFQFSQSAGQVAIVRAFPRLRENSTLGQALREQGVDVLLVLKMGDSSQIATPSDPQLRLPDEVDPFVVMGSGLSWPTLSRNRQGSAGMGSNRTSAKKSATPPANEVQIISIALQHANAESLARLIPQLFSSQPLSIAADQRTNSVLVRGPRDLLAEIEAIALRLDQPNTAGAADEFGNPPRNTLGEGSGNRSDSLNPLQDSQFKTTPGKGERIVVGAPQITAAEWKIRCDAEELKASQKAEQLRALFAQGFSNQDPRVTQLRTELRGAVAASFAARQQFQRAELAEFQNRTLQIRQTITQREVIQDQIIDRRVEDLLNPDLQWNFDPPTSASGTRPVVGSPIGVPGPPKSGSPAPAAGSPPGDPNSRPASSAQVPVGRGQLLSDAVRAFNEKHETNPHVKDQPPLTDDEVVAAIRWNSSTRENRQRPAAESAALVAIAENRLLPENAQLELSTDFDQPDGKLTKWTISISFRQPSGSTSSHLIREQLIGWQPKTGNGPNNPGSDLTTDNPQGKPLVAAINGFNAAHESDPIGKYQPPLTSAEVLAAIRWWNTKRNEADLTNKEFQAFQAIADTKMLPEKAEFEVISSFRPNDEFEFSAWSVRIVMPRLSKPGWTYGFTIRDRWITSTRLNKRPISWGLPAADGIQAGVLFDPSNEQYTHGQSVRPTFIYRNIGNQPLSVAFPRLMTHGYYESLHASDSSGRAIAIDQDSGPGGPVGWIETPLPPKSQHEIPGMPILLGDLPRKDGVETVIKAQPGQTCRVRFSVPNYGAPNSEPLQTGEIRFTIAN